MKPKLTALKPFLFGTLAVHTALLLGAGIAQAAPAYVIGETEVLDAQGLEPYRAQMIETLKPYGGEFIVRGSYPEVVEGAASKGRIAVVRFPSLEDAQNWYNSDAYKKVRPIRHRTTDSRVMIVEGLEK